MALIVQKFGGTSVGSIEKIQAVAKRVIEKHLEGNRMIVVLSAMAGETDRLIGMAHAIQRVPDLREQDMLVSSGEQVSVALFAMTRLGSIPTKSTPAPALPPLMQNVSMAIWIRATL